MPRSERQGLAAIVTIAMLLAATACAPEAPAPPAAPRLATPQQSGDGWSVGDPASAGFDPDALAALTGDIASGAYPNTHALLIEHDGALVYEQYFTGTDERWGEPLGTIAFGPDDLHDLRSISKSVTSALLGIALDGQDLDAALQRPAVDYLEGVAPEDKRAITLHHVLTMTAGLQWNEMTVPYTDATNDEIRLYDATDPAAYVFSRPLEQTPGSTWYYSGGLSQVLATVVHGISGEPLGDFARDHLFAPLGIAQVEWLGPGTWTPDDPAAMSGLRLRARDLAKVGSVYLHGGRWNGNQVVPAEWVERSTTRHVAEIGDWSDGGVWGYGYQWWVGRLPSGERVAAGFGNGNQRLFVLPDERLVVTIFAGEYNQFAGHSNRLLASVLAAR